MKSKLGAHSLQIRDLKSRAKAFLAVISVGLDTRGDSINLAHSCLRLIPTVSQVDNSQMDVTTFFPPFLKVDSDSSNPHLM